MRLTFALGIDLSLPVPLLVGGAISLVLVLVLTRAMVEDHSEPVSELGATAQRRWIVGLVLTQVAALLALAAAGSSLVAALLSLLVNRVRSPRSNLLGAWIVPSLRRTDERRCCRRWSRPTRSAR